MKKIAKVNVLLFIHNIIVQNNLFITFKLDAFNQFNF